MTESQGVIHITVYYRFLSDSLSTGPFDLFPRCAFGVGGLDFFPVWAQLELIFGFQVTSKNNNKQLLDEVEHDIMNYQNRGLCYLPKPKAEADNTDTRF